MRYLAKLRNMLYGAATLFEIFPEERVVKFKRPSKSYESDCLRRDWGALGRDMGEAMKQTKERYNLDKIGHTESD